MSSWLRSTRRLVREWWGVFALVAFFAAGHFITKNFNAKMRQERRYTLGTVYGIRWTAKAGRFAYARFSVAGTRYIAQANADAFAGQPLVGRRFLVKFHPPDPGTYSVLYLHAAAPAGLADVPAAGWATPPFAVPDEVLQQP